MNMFEAIAATKLAQEIEAALRAVIPDSPLARVRVEAGAEAVVVVLYTCNAEIAYTDEGVSRKDGASARWWPLPHASRFGCSAPDYLAWLKAGNVGWPTDFTTITMHPDAVVTMAEPPAGVFGK